MDCLKAREGVKMEKFFYPQSVAVIGVSERPENLARNILINLINWEYKGKIYPVGPKGGKVFGKKIYPSLLDIPQKVDLAVVLTPAQVIPRIMDDCYKKGIKRVAISSGGFSEFSKEGQDLNKIICEKAKDYNIRFVGPNGIAVINSEIGLCLPFAPLEKSRVGNISILTQSGGVGVSILIWLGEENLYCNKFVSLGNKADLDEVDFLAYLKDDPGTEVIILYLESIERGKEFVKVAKKIKKPILLYKANRSQAGQEMAFSHTAALANDEEVLEEAVRQAGVIRVDELPKLATLSKVFNLPRIKGNRLVAISAAGGHMVAAADAAELNGFSFPPLSPRTKKEMEGYSRASVIKLTNPLDLGDAFSSKAALTSVEMSLRQRDIDGVIMILLRRKEHISGMSPAYQRLREDIIPSLERVVKRYSKPFILGLVSNASILSSAKERVTFPVLSRPEECFELLGIFRDFCLRKEDEEEIPEFKVKRGKVKEIITKAKGLNRIRDLEGFEILKSYGIPTIESCLAKSQKEARDVAERLGYPLVMKIVSKDILHKTDIGGVKVGIDSKREVSVVYRKMLLGIKRKMPRAVIEGVLLYKMVPPGEEVILGVKEDASFGHLLMFGLGGIFVEVLKDVSFRLIPLTKRDAQDMVCGIKSYPLLKGVRGKKGVDVSSIVENILRLSQLVSDFPEIKELDINPLLVHKKGSCAVDVRMMIGGQPVKK